MRKATTGYWLVISICICIFPVIDVGLASECVTQCPLEPDESGALNIVDTSAARGSDVTVTIEINDAPNRTTSLGFEVLFEPAECLEYTGAFEPGDLTAGFDFFECNLSAPGVIICGGFTTQGEIPEGAGGDVVDLTFHVHAPELDDPGEAVRLDLQNLVDDTALWPHSPGYVCGGCSCDVNGSGRVTPLDALCVFLKYLGHCPRFCPPCEEMCCDVTGDGECSPDDAREIFNKFLGRPGVCSPRQ